MIHLSSFYLSKNSCIDPASTWPGMLSTSQRLVDQELFHQSSFKLKRIF